MSRPACRHCHKPDPDGSRGLCWPCYRKPAIRKKYPTIPRPVKLTGREMACRACNQPRLIRCRGLCSTCYANRAIRAATPPVAAKAAVKRDVTLEDLDKLIEEQRANAPAWFFRDAHRRKESPMTVPLVRLGARGSHNGKWII